MVAKRNRGKQRHVPLTPTIVQPSAATSKSSQALSDESSPSSVELVRPFIHGLERHSVLIDVTNISDIGLLEERLKQFNAVSDQPDRSNDFIGYPETVRTYLGHRFLETMWVMHSEGRQIILEDGVYLSDGTFVKGFESYPVDAKLVHVKLENLPYLPGRLVMEDMHRILSCYGEVLDVGITQVNGLFHGKGYATLNLKPRDPQHVCLSMDHPHGTPDSTCDGYLYCFEELTRVIPWEEDDGYYRHVLAQWDSMPEFCRICQKPGHCRADCSEYKKHLTCHHCNQHGHISRNCPRHNDSQKVRIVEKSVEQKAAARTRSKGKGRASQATARMGNRSSLDQAAANHSGSDVVMGESTASPPQSAAAGLEHTTDESTSREVVMLDPRPQDPHASNNSTDTSETPSLSPANHGEEDSPFNNKLLPPGSPSQATGDVPAISGTAPGSALTNALLSTNNGTASARVPPFDANSPLLKTPKMKAGDVSHSRQRVTEEHRQAQEARARELTQRIAEASNPKTNL